MADRPDSPVDAGVFLTSLSREWRRPIRVANIATGAPNPEAGAPGLPAFPSRATVAWWRLFSVPAPAARPPGSGRRRLRVCTSCPPVLALCRLPGAVHSAPTEARISGREGDRDRTPNDPRAGRTHGREGQPPPGISPALRPVGTDGRTPAAARAFTQATPPALPKMDKAPGPHLCGRGLACSSMRELKWPLKPPVGAGPLPRQSEST
jgi:hypothetical protein